MFQGTSEKSCGLFCTMEGKLGKPAGASARSVTMAENATTGISGAFSTSPIPNLPSDLIHIALGMALVPIR